MNLRKGNLVNLVLLKKSRENGDTNGTRHSILLPEYALCLFLAHCSATGRVTVLHLMGVEKF